MTDRSTQNEALRILLGGVLGMMVAMGIGRFVYTPILPLMQRDLGMSHSMAGWLAGLNYLGYLLGAVFCTISPHLLRLRLVSGGALFVCVLSTFFMGFTTSALVWLLLRFGAGFASAVLFVIISAEVSEALARRQFAQWIGGLFAGVGLGIALSGLIVPELDKLGGWSTTWMGAGVVAMILAGIGIKLGRVEQTLPIVHAESSAFNGMTRLSLKLTLSYFFEGLGYIVTATFLVAIVSATPGLETFAPYSWVAVGVAAVPSTIIWPLLARRFGTKKALLLAYVIQLLGLLISLRAQSMLAVTLSAVSFGGTFLGIVTLTLSEGQRRFPRDTHRIAAFLTASFGVGQMLGPVLGGWIADLQAGFDLPLLLASGCVFLGGLCIALDGDFTLSPRN